MPLSKVVFEYDYFWLFFEVIITVIPLSVQLVSWHGVKEKMDAFLMYRQSICGGHYREHWLHILP
jgi:hypothetical protein